jgi:AcrR family transcriptional regulator
LRTSAEADAAPRQRLAPADRRRAILAAAVAYFAEVGFGADTRDLAARLGITQALLYRYFPSKDALVEAVFDEIYARRLDPSLRERLRDRGRPLRERLLAFTRDYSMRTFRPEWIRLYTFAGLRGGAFNRRYIARVTEPLLRTICAELRASLGLRGRARRREIDLAWVWHGGLYYAAIRKHVYGLAAPVRIEALAADSVDMLIAGLTALHRAGRTH